MYRLLPLVVALTAHRTALASADDGLPLSTLQALKQATVFVKVESPASAKVRVWRGDGQADASVDLGQKYSGSGSGFVMLVEGDTAYVVTNHHVATPTIEVSSADFPATITRRYNYPAPGSGRNLRVPSSVQVTTKRAKGTLENGAVSVVFRSGTQEERVIPATIAATDPERDLAVLKIKTTKDVPKPIDFAHTPKVVETMPVYVFGFPFGRFLATGSENPAITVGKGSVSSIRLRNNGEPAMVQIDGALNPGNSGGPIVDSEGHLIGVAVATIRGGNNIGFAIPPQELTKMLAGRVGTCNLHVARADNGGCKVQIQVGLIDPLEKIRAVTFDYIPSERMKGPGSTDSGVGTLPGGKQLNLKIDHQKAVGELNLDRTQSGASIGFQVGIRSGDGKLAFTRLINHRIKVPPEANATAKAAPTSATGEGPRLVRLAQTADAKVWQEKLKIVKAGFEEKSNEVTWLVEAKKDIGYFGELNRRYEARFVDADNAVINTVTIQFKPATDFKKGERFRAYLKLPTEEDTVQKSTKVLLIEKK